MITSVILTIATVACVASGHKTLAIFAGIFAAASLIVVGWDAWRPEWARREYAARMARR